MGCRQHDQVNAWGASLPEALAQRAERTRRELQALICSALGPESRAWRVCLAGSVLNGTATACSSDLDLHVVLCDRFAYELPESTSLRGWVQMQLGCSVECGFPESRRKVEEIVQRYYGKRVTYRPKAIHIEGDRCRLPADVVVGIEHRRFTGAIDHVGQPAYVPGVELRSRDDPQTPVVCYPQLRCLAIAQHDAASGGRSRAIMRIVKCVRHAMRRSDTPELQTAAEKIPSCLIEAILAAVPPEYYRGSGICFWAELHRVMPCAIALVSSPRTAGRLMDLGGVRPLFAPGQSWTREQSWGFLSLAWERMRTHTLPLPV